MKQYQLLESIGAVDEELLEQAETARYARRSPMLKVLLVAAIMVMLSVSVLAVEHLFVDVNQGELMPHEYKIINVDGDYSLDSGYERSGYRVIADIDTVKDLPMKLLYPYLPAVPKEWKCIGAASGRYDGEYGMIGIRWEFERDGVVYEVSYRQESAYFYNTSKEKVVWDITNVPSDMTVTGRVQMLEEAKVYRVFLSGTAEKNTIYQKYGQSLIFWSDGYSVFHLQVPDVMSDAEIFDLMCSLELCNSDLGAALSGLK